MGAALTELIDIMTGGLVDFAGGLAEGINAYIVDLFFIQTEGVITGLSPTGGTVAIFAAVALGIGITTLIWNFVTSLGN